MRKRALAAIGLFVLLGVVLVPVLGRAPALFQQAAASLDGGPAASGIAAVDRAAPAESAPRAGAASAPQAPASGGVAALGQLAPS